MSTITCAILTISDRCSKGVTQDTAGPSLVRIAQDRLGAMITRVDCIPDDRKLIRQTLIAWTSSVPAPHLILTTGGTGLSPRDITPEATLDVLERRHPGLMELVRFRGSQHTPNAFLSRGEAGTIGQTLIINLPGSERGATESLKALLDILPHALENLQDAPHEDSRIKQD